MRNPSLTQFYNLVESNSGINLRSVMLVPLLMLLMTISGFSQATPSFTCDADCEGFLQLELCITTSQANPPVSTSSGDFHYKPLSDACPVLIDSHGPVSAPRFVFENTEDDTYCFDGFYMQYGESVTYVIRDAVNNPIAGTGSTGTITAPAAPILSISGPSEACVGSEDSAEFVASIDPATDGTWSVTNAGGVQIQSEVAVDGETISFAFEGAGNYTIGLSLVTAEGCTFTTTAPFSAAEPTGSIEGDSFVCDDDPASVYFFQSDSDLDCTPEFTLMDASGADVSSFLIIGTQPGVDPAFSTGIAWPAGADANSPYTLTFDCTAGINCNLAEPETLEITFSDGTASQMACNNLVNITLNQNCELIVTPDMILEGTDDDPDRFSVVITDIDTGEELPDVLDYSHVGGTFQVMVIEDCSLNSCWGFIKVEDKGIPTLECPEESLVNCEQLYDYTLTGFPVFDPNEVTVTPSASNNGSTDDSWLVTGFDNCTDATLTYTDAIDSESCEFDEPGTVIARTWTITDALGHSSSCTHLVSIIRPEISSIEGPLSWDDNIAGANPSIDLCDLDPFSTNPIPLDENGNPHPDFTGYPDGLFCMNVTLRGYDDVRELEKCGTGSEARKIIREWSLHEACTGEIVTLTQIITIADNAPPATTCPADNIFIPADPYECGTAVEIFPYPGSNGLGEIVALVECSSFTLEVFYKAALPGTIIPGNDEFTSLGFVDGPDDSVIVPATDGKRVWITYLVEDACGNTAFADAINNSGDDFAPDEVSCFYEINYQDVTPPQPVCDLFSVVSVGANGCTKAGPQSFNDFSHDNCSDELTFGVQRMDDFNANGENFGDFVEFCCDDVKFTVVDGENVAVPVMVILNVTDEEGNSSSCMVEVTVKDPISPNLTDCPSSTTVDCEDTRLGNLASFGAPSNTDNCGATLTKLPDVIDLDECGVGTIVRSWTLVDASGNAGQSCTQTIRVTNMTPFAISDQDFPADVTVGCNDSTDPADTGEPSISAIGCSNVLYSYDDTRFTSLIGSNYCEKILRKWSVIDWCNQGNTTVYTQVIRIEDNAAPVVFCPVADLSNDLIFGSCNKEVTLVATANDDCTDASELTLYHTVSINGGNAMTSSGGDATQLFPIGTHSVTFFAEDNCGNVGQCSLSFTIDDNILPTPYCLDEVVTVISAATGTAEVWAEDLNAGSFDNCPDGGSDVEVSFSPTPGDLVRFFTCEDLTNGVVDTFDVNVYVIDEDGNSDFCTAQVIVQDNNDLCPDLPVIDDEDEGDDEGSSRVAISGEIATENNRIITDAMVRLSSSLPEFPMEEMSDNGDYMFDELLGNNTYMVTAEKNDAHGNGVSTLDIILIQRHILNIQDLDSPYKLIAADADNSGYVSASDLVDIRKLILEIYTEFPDNNSWRFVKSDFAFLDPAQPFPFEEEVDLDNLGTDANIDFTAVKIGDVNQSATVDELQGSNVESRGNNPLRLQTAVRESVQGTTYLDIVAAHNYSLVGLQMGITTQTAIETIADGVLDLNDTNLNLSESDKGQLLLSWNTQDATHVNAGDVLFTLVVDGDDATQISLDETAFSTEVYTTQDDGALSIQPIVIEGITADSEFVLYQNRPNPFSESTLISFSLPVTQSATLSIMDVTGKVVYSVTDTYNKGYNEVLFNTSIVNTTGILYYQIETETYSSTKKMVILK